MKTKIIKHLNNVSLDMCLKPYCLVSDWLQILCVLPVSTEWEVGLHNSCSTVISSSRVLSPGFCGDIKLKSTFSWLPPVLHLLQNNTLTFHSIVSIVLFLVHIHQFRPAILVTNM